MSRNEVLKDFKIVSDQVVFRFYHTIRISIYLVVSSTLKLK